MNRIDIDISCLPAVVVTLEGEVSDQGYLDYLKKLTGILKVHRPRAVIIDASLSDMHAPRHATMQADWVNANRTLLHDTVSLTALVVNRPVLRFALSAFFAITSLPSNFCITATCDEARLRVREALRAQGCAVPEAFVPIGGVRKGREALPRGTS